MLMGIVPIMAFAAEGDVYKYWHLNSTYQQIMHTSSDYTWEKSQESPPGIFLDEEHIDYKASGQDGIIKIKFFAYSPGWGVKYSILEVVNSEKVQNVVSYEVVMKEGLNEFVIDFNIEEDRESADLFIIFNKGDLTEITMIPFTSYKLTETVVDVNP